MIDRLADAEHVHLIGIGGSGMAALGHLLLLMGKRVSGSDLADSDAIRQLRAGGATVHLGHAAEHLGDADYVVRSSAVPADNPEVVAADRRGLPNLKHADVLGELMRDRSGVAVAGTHGKTTTTGLVTWLLDRGGQDPLSLIGGEAISYGSGARLGEGPVVVEADEFDRRFLRLAPEVAVVTGIEADHLDYYRDLDEITAAFQQFVDALPSHGRLVVCADDPRAAALTTRAQRETYGYAEGADWRVTDYAPLPSGGARFAVHTAGRAWPAESPLVGRHNAQNAAAALAVADYFGVGLRAALSALADFRGTRRRFETRGRPGGVWVVDDYAHHPSEIRTVLAAARERVPPPGEIWAIFQPHSASRTASLLDGFSQAFSDADHVLVLPIYRPTGRESAETERGVTSDTLVRAMRATGQTDARLAESFEAALALVADRARAGDLVLTLGAGDVTLLADRLVAALGERRSGVPRPVRP
jgi:UDP-N-acetylmuramate--alanine ligase